LSEHIGVSVRVFVRVFVRVLSETKPYLILEFCLKPRQT